MTRDLSIIIVSWNVQQLLKNCLISLFDSISDLTFEVLVVDNASSDGSAEMVRTEFRDVKLIVNCENVGFGKANNQALEICQGKYILFLNPDTIVPKGSIKELVEFLDHHPTVGMVGPECIDGKGCLRFNWGRLSIRGFAEFIAEKLVSIVSQTSLAILFKHPRPVRWLTGACWLVRRNVLDEAGPYDEKLFMYGEEPDFCYRVRNKGWKIYLLRHVHIVHYKSQSVRQVGKVLPRFLKSIVYVMKKIARDRLRSALQAHVGETQPSR